MSANDPKRTLAAIARSPDSHRDGGIEVALWAGTAPESPANLDQKQCIFIVFFGLLLDFLLANTYIIAVDRSFISLFEPISRSHAMRKSESTVTLTAAQKEDCERDRLKQISLKWAKIAREKAKEDFFSRNGVIAKMDPGSRYDLYGIPPAHAITVCLDIDPSEVELALATNGTSLRRATLTALLAAMVVDDVATLNGSGAI